jgi:LAO/AO transport system kinase
MLIEKAINQPVTQAGEDVQNILSGQRRALAQAITLVESTRPDHQRKALKLLEELRRASPREALRIGLSGTPGVGKSTFIETFGMMLIDQGLKVAVLAVDPSSTRSGGSILGDKTRMERLSRQKNAFIRPSPNQTSLGGVARRSREAICLCEAAGFDVILIETVGVGQSEIQVSDMVDIFVLLLAPAGGDELQGVKRGIMEIADLVLINKADGDLKPAAMRTCADYSGALRLLRSRPNDPEGFPKALTVSSLGGDGVAQCWRDINTLADWRREQGVWASRRQAQAVGWFEAEVQAGMIAQLLENEQLKEAQHRFHERVLAGEISPEKAAAQVLLHLKQK